MGGIHFPLTHKMKKEKRWVVLNSHLTIIDMLVLSQLLFQYRLPYYYSDLLWRWIKRISYFHKSVYRLFKLGFLLWNKALNLFYSGNQKYQEGIIVPFPRCFAFKNLAPAAIDDAAICNKKIKKLSQIAASSIAAGEFFEFFRLPTSIDNAAICDKKTAGALRDCLILQQPTPRGFQQLGGCRSPQGSMAAGGCCGR